ncbi:hypothetical protein V3I01_13515 [Sphingomonas sp. gentR]|uniref:hypothetical protein n=1 Tax=Sphingomonas sp. gentR TaxID=3118768 RepID=UPI0030D0AFD9
MMIRKRLAALEARKIGDGLSLAARAWLGHTLTSDERTVAERETAASMPVDWSRISKEATTWLQA